MNLINVTGTAAVACSKSLPSPVCPSCKEMCILDVESREQSLIHPLVSCHSHGLCLHCLLHKATALKKWEPGDTSTCLQSQCTASLLQGQKKIAGSSPAPAFGPTHQRGAEQASQDCSGWSFAQHSDLAAS